MARLVAVCREGEEDYPFLSRQIPLYIDDTLTVSKITQMCDQNAVCCEVPNSAITLHGLCVITSLSFPKLIGKCRYKIDNSHFSLILNDVLQLYTSGYTMKGINLNCYNTKLLFTYAYAVNTGIFI